MYSKINENNTKNLIYISHADILHMAEDIYENDMDWLDIEWFINVARQDSYIDIKYYRNIIDRTYLLRNLQKNINWFLEWILLEYAKRKWITDFKIWKNRIQWVQKEKIRQNLVDMLIEKKFDQKSMLSDIHFYLF